MPVEIIGEFGTPGASGEWLNAQGKLTIRHIKTVCGEPPPEMTLEIVWQEHELGSYPVIALIWDDPCRGAPSNYLERCEAALAAYENGGELPPGWTMPPVRSDDDDEVEDPFDPNHPPEPEGPLDYFELEQNVGKLIQWALKSADYHGSRPRLVESDGRSEEEKE